MKSTGTSLCPELAAILQRELDAGNVLKEGPVKAGWSEKESVFAALEFDLRSDSKPSQAPVRHSICNDPHYGWHNECYCELHKHFLVAGATKHPWQETVARSTQAASRWQ